MAQEASQMARSVEWTCQAVSPLDEPCTSVANYQCGVCGQWYCALHAEDEAWHRCALEPGEEGGEG
jgi:hypothetical protein